jgi:ATP-dependent helicase/nuclease subunit B
MLDPAAVEGGVSATALEALAGCPFRHFLRRGLGVEPLDDPAPDPDRWLDPLALGQVFHELFARCLRELRAAGERPDPARHAARLLALGEARLQTLRRLMPPPSELVFEREARAFRRDLETFLRFEAGETGRTPVGFEVAFGTGGGDGEPLARAEPIPIDLGPGLRFRLRGRIDRIDRLTTGDYEAVDYKTGGYWPAAWAGRFAGGRVLQHALYALAAAELLRAGDAGARVASASYYFPTVRGRGMRVVRSQGDPAGLARVLADLFGLVRAGAFVHTVDENDCRFCEHWRACGPAPAVRAARKVGAAGNPPLEPYRRLQAHE